MQLDGRFRQPMKGFSEQKKPSHPLGFFYYFLTEFTGLPEGIY
jgi:hypothetical protein